MTSKVQSTHNSNNRGEVTDETLLKVAKEITVKFIEIGRITPASFESDFRNIYSAINITVREK